MFTDSQLADFLSSKAYANNATRYMYMHAQSKPHAGNGRRRLRSAELETACRFLGYQGLCDNFVLF